MGDEAALTIKSNTQRVMGVLEQMAHEVPGFVHSAVVDLEMANPVAEYADPGVSASGLDLGKTASLYTDMVRIHLKNIQCLGGDDALGETQDMFIATDRFYMIMKPMPSIMCYQCMLIRRNDNLGIARSVLRRYSDTIETLIKG